MGKTVHKVGRDVPEQLTKIMSQAWSGKPEQRQDTETLYKQVHKL